MGLSAAGPRAGNMRDLRDVWEATSFNLERLQAAEECVAAEQARLHHRSSPAWVLPWRPSWSSPRLLTGSKPRVAVVRHACCASLAASYLEAFAGIDVRLDRLVLKLLKR